MNVIRPDDKEPSAEFALAPTQYKNRYVTRDRSRQDEFDLLCRAAALRHLLVHSVVTVLLAVAAVGIIR